MHLPQQQLIDGIRHHYWEFPSWPAYAHFVAEEFRRLNGENRETWRDFVPWLQTEATTDPEYLGGAVPADVEALEDHVLFTDSALFSQLEARLHPALHRLRQQAQQRLVPVKTLRVNSRGLGVFSFPLAAKGLYLGYKKEYGDEISTAISQLRMCLGMKVTKTQNRRIFLDFRPQTQARKAVSLYVLSGNDGGINASDMIYTGLACALVAEFMEAQQVPVEVKVIHGTVQRTQAVLSVITVKSFHQRFDRNTLLLLTSDARYFRFQGFKGYVAMMNALDLAIDEDFGLYPPQLGKRFVDACYPGGLVFENSTALDASRREIQQIISSYVHESTRP